MFVARPQCETRAQPGEHCGKGAMAKVSLEQPSDIRAVADQLLVYILKSPALFAAEIYQSIVLSF